MSTTEVRTSKPARKPRARHRDVVLGCIDERLTMLAEQVNDNDHVSRLFALMDELRRSLNGEPRDAEEK